MALLCNDVSHWLGAISILQRLSLAGRKPRISPAICIITGQKRTFIRLMVIAVTNHFCQGILNHWQLNSLFSSLCRLTTKNIWELCITGLLWEETTCDGWIPLTKCRWHRKYFHVMTSWHHESSWFQSICDPLCNVIEDFIQWANTRYSRSDSRFAPSQWETLLCKDVSHWLGASLESIL